MIRGTLIIAAFLIATGLQAQIAHGNKDDNLRVFDAGVALGLNFSQVHGDNLAGFNKIGFTGGVLTHINFDPNWSIGLEVNYSQKGSATFPDPNDPFEYKLSMQYAEIPVLVNFNDKNRLIFSGGLAYGRLFSVREVVNGNETSNISEAISNDELSFIMGGTILIGEMRHFGANFRYQRSITTVGESAQRNVPGLINVALTIRGIYYF
jgi:hypothetical protein